MYEYSDKESARSDFIFDTLLLLTRLLTDNGIPYWLSYGTLLGAIRENDIIKYDYDFDICAFYKDKDQILNLNKDYKKHGIWFHVNKNGCLYDFPKTGRKYKRSRPFQWHISYKVRRKRKTLGDVYFYQGFNDGIMRRYCLENESYFLPSCAFPTWHVEEFDTVTIRDEKFTAPRGAEAWMDYHYNDWKTPRRAKSVGGKKETGYLYYGESTTRDFSKLMEVAGLDSDCYNRKLEGKHSDMPEWPRKIKHISWYRLLLEYRWLRTYDCEFCNFNYRKDIS